MVPRLDNPLGIQSDTSCTSHPLQASSVSVEAKAYGALLNACVVSLDVSPPHDWALSTLETMQVLRAFPIAASAVFFYLEK